MQTKTAQRFTLSFAGSDETQSFDTPEAAGRAYALAPAALGPRVIASLGRGARTIARSMRTTTGFAKAAPRPEHAADTSDATFWSAYHAAA